MRWILSLNFREKIFENSVVSRSLWCGAGEDRGFTRLGWDDALELIADRIRKVEPKRLAFYLTSRGITNEVYYGAQKVARFLGTNNIDNSARICHAPSTTALKRSIGYAASTCSYSDWIGTDLLVFFGSHVANNQPVATKYMYRAKGKRHSHSRCKFVP